MIAKYYKNKTFIMQRKTKYKLNVYFLTFILKNNDV